MLINNIPRHTKKSDINIKYVICSLRIIHPKKTPNTGAKKLKDDIDEGE